MRSIPAHDPNAILPVGGDVVLRSDRHSKAQTNGDRNWARSTAAPRPHSSRRLQSNVIPETQLMELTFRASRLQRIRRGIATSGSAPQRPRSLVDVAQQVLDHARSRSQFMPGAIFEDPQWLMTLDLFIAAEEGREVSVSSLACASGVPPTTALRHIRYLQAQGIFERISHPNDKRISLVRLADASRSQIARYLSSIGSNPIAGGRHSTPAADL